MQEFFGDISLLFVLQVAHAFILGTAYSEALNAVYMDKQQQKW